MTRTTGLLLATLCLGLAATPAGAHVGVHVGVHAGDMHSFSGGLLHPLGGLDHLLAAFAVGLWAVLSGARRPWLLPVAFVTLMTLATVAAASGLKLPYIEPAIAATVIGLGLLVAFAIRTSTGVGAVLVGLFAIVHGYAHGAEGGAAAMYLVGLIVATGLLHVAGVVAGRLSLKIERPMLARAAGAVIAAAGAYILVA